MMSEQLSRNGLLIRFAIVDIQQGNIVFAHMALVLAVDPFHLQLAFTFASYSRHTDLFTFGNFQ